MKATTAIFIDKYHPKSDKTCAVSVRVTHNRKKKYYPTPFRLTVTDYNKVMGEKPREPYKSIQLALSGYEKRAADIIDSLPIFTFSKFEAMYLTNQDAADSISAAFDLYINELKDEKRIGTASSYECAKNSFNEFKPGLKFADIDAKVLKKYENWMIEKGCSRTTVGIYIRSLRSIFNKANVDKALYPFGEGKEKYSIPTGRNIKKALSIEEIQTIFQYKPENETEEKYRDYWIFIYLCNGLNVKDLCLLRWSDIDGDVLSFERAKTVRSKRESERIIVSLKPQTKAIVKKYGIPSVSKDSFIFPHLEKSMSEERRREVVQYETKKINRYMKRIAKKLGINKPVTSYFARHSFATVLKNSGASVEFISEALGHGNIKTTKAYLDGFETEKIHQVTDALTAGF